MNITLHRIINIIVYLFAAIGLFLVLGYLAVRLGFTNNKGFIDDRFITTATTTQSGADIATTSPEWNNTPEWTSLKAAIIKDKPMVDKVSSETGVPSRFLVSLLIVEQLRLFNDDRESFKKFFEPLKILGTQSVFSWGILGIKKETAIEIEKNLKNPDSPRYPGAQYEHMLDFKTADIDKERFERLTDQHNHYYDYLYAALFIKQIEAEWSKAGHDISNRPEILATLYNLGFSKSQPNPDPKVGGAAIPIGNKTYSFGGLAYDFYYSDELTAEFPR